MFARVSGAPDKARWRSLLLLDVWRTSLLSPSLPPAHALLTDPVQATSAALMATEPISIDVRVRVAKPK